MAFEIAAARRSSERMLSELRRELSMYRAVLMLSGHPGLTPAPLPKTQPSRRLSHRKAAELKPLAVPDPILLQHLDPQLAEFIRDNPDIESIFTREIVRDLDSKRLDFSRLLVKSRLEIGFGIESEGHITKPRILKSSTVPSIDHLAIELVQLLEKYKLLGTLGGIERIVAGISVGEVIEVTIAADIHEPGAREEVERRIRAGLAFLRFAVQKEEATYFLQGISISFSEGRVYLTKTFEKDSLLAFLRRYYQPRTPE
jgi:hypothetical protein